MKKLPEHLRDLLKKPIGLLVDEEKLVEILKNKNYIVSVGDQVTYTLLKHDIKPFMGIVDYKTRRGSCSDDVKNLIKSFGKKTFVVKNPPGCISDDLWNVIKFAFENINSDSNMLIEVEGEEDLASLAVIYMAPSDVTIIYGLPDRGVLVVKPTSEIKQKIKKVLDEM
ncbi:MAG TPA: DUF359 domain-containing protein [Thermoplasmatales archaeon]|nr:DUF359 domain-containing protein [Thermoplasmatales archaeon]